MRKLYLFAALLIWHNAGAQNYQCLQAGVKHYFTNGNSYLRGMRIDSVRTAGSDIIFYPFHTPRGYYSGGGGSFPMDASGGSWLGKKVVQQPDGTFLFDNIWHDTVVIKTQANTGDSWVFYTDSSARYYRATVAGTDTMTILGTTDSIKTITIAAYDGSGYLPSDPLNGYTIVLSRNHGFAKVFDLYIFPYTSPAMPPFAIDDDYYLNTAEGTGSLVSGRTFSLVAFNNPTHEQLYDWNTGDYFENSIYAPGTNSSGLYPYGYDLDTITNKVVTASSVTYYVSGWRARQVFGPGPPMPDYNYPYSFEYVSGTLVEDHTLLFDTTKMPEETGQQIIIYYLPGDTGFCTVGNKYRIFPSYMQDTILSLPMEGEAFIYYKTGIGLEQFFTGALELMPSEITDTTLLFMNRGGTPCGNFTWPSPIITAVSNLSNPGQVANIFPNPAAGRAYISTSLPAPYTVTVQNMLGQTLLTVQAHDPITNIDLSGIPAGIYVAVIANEESRIVKQLVIAR